MGNNVTLNAIKGVHFLRNTCSGGITPSSSSSAATTTTSQPPPSLLSRKTVVRKAFRRPSKVPKKPGLPWDELSQTLLLNNKVRGGRTEGGSSGTLYRVGKSFLMNIKF